jgi:hypothetical protein
MDRYRELTRAYLALPNSGRAADGYNYTDEALQMFPRYLVVEAILNKVEELDSDNLPAVEKLTGLLISAAYSAQSPSTRPRAPIPEQVMVEERKLFAERVLQLVGDTDAVVALPYRRTLAHGEGEQWLASLQQRWGVVNHEWYPMLDAPVPDDVLVLRQDGLVEGSGEAFIRAALSEMGVKRVLELREDLVHREIDLELLTPTFSISGEGLWTDESLAWIIYASHESTVAFGGSIREHLILAWSGIDQWRWRA